MPSCFTLHTTASNWYSLISKYLLNLSGLEIAAIFLAIKVFDLAHPKTSATFDFEALRDNKYFTSAIFTQPRPSFTNRATWHSISHFRESITWWIVRSLSCAYWNPPCAHPWHHWWCHENSCTCSAHDFMWPLCDHGFPYYQVIFTWIGKSWGTNFPLFYTNDTPYTQGNQREPWSSAWQSTDRAMQ